MTQYPGHIASFKNMTVVAQDELKTDWSDGNVFRRYFRGENISIELATSISGAVSKLAKAGMIGPYQFHRIGGGFALIPSDHTLEPFEFKPAVRMTSFAMTRREPLHDAALVSVLRVIDSELRRREHELGLPTYSLGAIRCDCCGAHTQHRSLRVHRPPWPVADGSACSPWLGRDGVTRPS